MCAGNSALFHHSPANGCDLAGQELPQFGQLGLLRGVEHRLEVEEIGGRQPRDGIGGSGGMGEPGLHHFGPIRMAPSRRMVSPLSMAFSTMCAARFAYSAGRPSRDGCGTCWPEGVLGFLRQPGHHGRLEDARRDGDHPDQRARQFAGDRQRHRVHRTLGGGVGRLADLAVERGDGGGVDDDAALRPAELGHGRLGGRHRGRGQADDVEGAHEVDLDDAVEGLQRQHAVPAQHLAGGGDPGAVDHDPQRTEGDGGVDGGLHLDLAGDVGGNEDRPVRRLRCGSRAPWTLPWAFSSAANAAPAEPGRSTRTTEAPASNRRRAVAAPRPEAPPVISATVPLMSMHPP